MWEGVLVPWSGQAWGQLLEQGLVKGLVRVWVQLLEQLWVMELEQLWVQLWVMELEQVWVRASVHWLVIVLDLKLGLA
jgi:hypothetical protein